jgi:hypothetical protein
VFGEVPNKRLSQERGQIPRAPWNPKEIASGWKQDHTESPPTSPAICLSAALVPFELQELRENFFGYARVRINHSLPYVYDTFGVPIEVNRCVLLFTHRLPHQRGIPNLHSSGLHPRTLSASG